MRDATKKAIIGAAFGIIIGGAGGYALGDLGDDPTVSELKTGEIIVDADGDGDFEKMTEEELHELRGHDQPMMEDHAHTTHTA